MITIKRVCGVVEVRKPTDLPARQAKIVEATPIEEKPKSKAKKNLLKKATNVGTSPSVQVFALYNLLLLDCI